MAHGLGASFAECTMLLARVSAGPLQRTCLWRHGWGVQTPKQEPVRIDRVADAYVQATRLKASAPILLWVCNTRFRSDDAPSVHVAGFPTRKSSAQTGQIKNPRFAKWSIESGRALLHFCGMVNSSQK